MIASGQAINIVAAIYYSNEIYIDNPHIYTTLPSPLLRGCTRGRLDLLGEGSDWS